MAVFSFWGTILIMLNDFNLEYFWLQNWHVSCFLFHDFVFRYSFTVELRVHCYFELVFNSPKLIHMIEVHSVSQIAFGTFRYENSTGYQIANSISKLYFRILKNIHQQCSTLADFFFLSFQMQDQDSFILLVFLRFFSIDAVPYSFPPFLQTFVLKALIDHMKKFALKEMRLIW